jgi:hypothetical protein
MNFIYTQSIFLKIKIQYCLFKIFTNSIYYILFCLALSLVISSSSQIESFCMPADTSTGFWSKLGTSVAGGVSSAITETMKSTGQTAAATSVAELGSIIRCNQMLEAFRQACIVCGDKGLPLPPVPLCPGSTLIIVQQPAAIQTPQQILVPQIVQEHAVLSPAPLAHFTEIKSASTSVNQELLQQASSSEGGVGSGGPSSVVEQVVSHTKPGSPTQSVHSVFPS